MPPHQSASAASFPSRGSQNSRQKAIPPPKAFPLKGRCRTPVRRMRWSANHRKTLWRRKALPHPAPQNLYRKANRKIKPPPAVTAITQPRQAMCHLISRLAPPASPRGEANLAAKSDTFATKKAAKKAHLSAFPNRMDAPFSCLNSPRCSRLGLFQINVPVGQPQPGAAQNIAQGHRNQVGRQPRPGDGACVQARQRFGIGRVGQG